MPTEDQIPKEVDVEQPEHVSRQSLDEFFDSMFHNLQEDNSFDPEVVRLVVNHLGVDNIHSQAGKRLAKSIIELAKERSKGEN
jgi:hypothetical protein